MTYAYVILHRSQTPRDAFEAIRAALRARLLLDNREGQSVPEWSVYPNGADYSSCFDGAVAFLSDQLKDRTSLTVIADGIEVDELNPRKHSSTWSGLLSMLVMAFPEIRWCFLAVNLRAPNEEERGSEEENELRKDALALRTFYSADTLTEWRGPSLFDGHGLREVISRQLNRPDRKDQAAHDCVPRRRFLAVVIDEEPDFSLFESLMAYGRGFRVHAVSSWAETERLLGKEGWLTAPDSPLKEEGKNGIPRCRQRAVRGNESGLFCLAIEDLYLNFPDHHEEGMSDLEKRNSALPALDTQRTPHLRRRFVSVGHAHGPDHYLKKHRNKAVIRALALREKAHSCEVREEHFLVNKPASGLYALWEKLGMKAAFPNQWLGRKYPGLAPEFEWPPRDDVFSRARRDNETGGHSAPGRLLQIAEHLLDRAAGLLESTRTVTDAVRGAVLATQALELISCRTPTTTLRALDLKHRFEIFAECHFSGMEYHLAIRDRMDDIRRNLAVTSYWLDEGKREDFQLNGEAKILAHLVAILEDHGSFEETEICRDRLRAIHFKILSIGHRRRHRLFYPLFAVWAWYITFVMHSGRNFIIAICVWAALLTFLYAWVVGDQMRPDGAFASFWSRIWQASYMAITALFSEGQDVKNVFGSCNVRETTCELGFPFRFVNGFAFAIGYFHFGVLVSHVYARFSRK